MLNKERNITTMLARRVALTITMACVAILVTLIPRTAQACGGFFCNLGTPVVQAAERILFAVEGDNVEAHIQIQYQGPAEDFSWVLPLPSVPEIGVGSEEVFRVLHQQTDPRFFIEWDNPEGCYYASGCYYMEDSAPTAAPSEGGGEGGVTILAEGAVGPYDYKVVGSGDPADLFAWLNENGYDQPEQAESLIGQYVEKGHIFVALKLLKDKEAGDIAPVVLKYNQESFACIPMVLTAIAATPDMPIYSWVLSGARAIPLNYFHVVLNAKAYDWIACAQDAGGWYSSWTGPNCQESYIDLVTKATDTAAGHAFVTEYAGTPSVMDEMLYQEGQYNLNALKAIDSASEFMQELLGQGFPRTSAMQGIIRSQIPMPDGLPSDCDEENEFYATWNIDECLAYMPEDWEFDAEAFVAAIEEQLLDPLKAAQELFGRFGYMTRLFSTLSPEEMTKDPIFSFNPDLPDVSNDHTVKGTATCDPADNWKATEITLTFNDGQTVTYEGEFWGCGGLEYADGGTAIASEAAAAEVQVLRESGGAIAVAPADVVSTDEELSQQYPTGGQSNVVADPDRNDLPGGNTGTFGTTPGEDVRSRGLFGCSAIPNGAFHWLIALLLSVMFVVRRRYET